jgi:hypothetical protein
MYKRNLSSATRRKVEILDQSILRKHLTDKHLTLALSYQRRLKIFPAWNETTPAFKDFEYRASYLEKYIRKMWEKYQGAMPCYALSANRQIVFECGGKLGGPQLLYRLLFKLSLPTITIDAGLPENVPKEIAVHYEPLVVATPYGNTQYYCCIPSSLPLLASSKGLIAPGIDVRCMNDFVPVPGSYRLDGKRWDVIGGGIFSSCAIPQALYDFTAEKNHHEQVKEFAELNKLKDLG